MNAILEERKKFEKEFEIVREKIKEFDKICIFRHIKPDFDALGTQFGLYHFLKDNFPNKDIHLVGDNHVTLSGENKLYPLVDKLGDEWFNDDFLAIIVDVGNDERIADPRYKKAKFKIKFDHHPKTDDIFDLEIVDTELASCSELVANFVLSFENLPILKDSASYFYSGIVGDSGRFLYSNTSCHTFEVTIELFKSNIDFVRIYELMYTKGLKDLAFIKFVLQNYKVTPNGTCYYVLTQKDLDELGLDSMQGKENVNFFSNYEGINICCSITEDITEPCFRISLRSRYYNVQNIAKKFEGGGHDRASGAKFKDLSCLDDFLKACDEEILKGKDI